MENTLFTCDDVVLKYRKRTALGGVTMTGAPGVTVLLGPNGAGKTSLLRLLMGELRPSSGAVTVDRFDPALDRRRLMRTIGWMPQDPRLPSRPTLSDFVTYAGWLKGQRWTRARTEAKNSLVSVGLGDRLNDPVGSLSGGMQRRAAFAAAIVHQPALLLLDEPMNGLDPEQRVQLHGIIRRQSENTCVVLSTHILKDLPDLADRVVILADGVVKFDGGYELLVSGSHTGDGPDLDAAYLNAVRGLAS